MNDTNDLPAGAIHIIAHAKHADDPELREGAAALAAQYGWDLVFRPTTGPGHASELAQEAAAAGVGRVIAVGGDGTINEIVSGLMSVAADHRPALGVVPRGTANDFASSAGLALELGPALVQAFTLRQHQPHYRRQRVQGPAIERGARQACAGPGDQAADVARAFAALGMA
jgi:diacylglycerol kinase family enzyme